MRKNMLLCALAMVLILLLAGCGCKHEWYAATCTSPKTCSLCGETEGETLPHTWQEATCTKAKTCAVCQATEGETLPHTWQDATCITPKTCAVCQATEGETLPHTWQDASCTTPKTCTVCNTTEGQPLGHAWLNATCTTAKTCSVCQATEGKPLGHSYSKEEILIAATCTQAGEKKYICVRCGHSTNESIPATGHQWEDAGVNSGVCTKCGTTGCKSNHNYTTTTIREPSRTFAGRRVLKCNDCGKEITEYFTDSQSFDLSAIAAEIAAYAEQKGFRPIIEESMDYNRKFSFSVLDSTLFGYGPNKLVNQAKIIIDSTYNDLTANGALLGKRNLHICVYYTQNGAIGGGFFGVCTKTSYYD